MIPQVVVSERGGAQTDSVEAASGLKDPHKAEERIGEPSWEGGSQRVRAPYPACVLGERGS